MWKLAIIFAVFVAVVIVSGKSLDDQACLSTPPSAMEPKAEFVEKVGNWYLTAGSQLQLYRTAADVLNVTVASLTPNDLYYRSCLRFLWSEQKLMTGFGGKSSDNALTPLPDGTNSFRFPNIGMDGTAIVVLTDNESFVMFYLCWAQGHDASYAVISTGPVLSKEAKKAVREKVKELGFEVKQFSLLRHESCEAVNAEAQD